MGLCGSKQENPKKKSYHLQTLDDHDGGINCMTLSEDGSVLVTGSEDRTARLWSSKTEKIECIGILKGHDDYINCVLVEDNYVLTGSADKTVRKWDMSTCDCVQVFKGHNSLINRIICTGDFIFSSSYDRTARCWDFDTGECIRVFSGHKRGVYPLIFIPADDEEIEPEDFSWDGNKDLLITGSADFSARSWSFETGKCLKVFKDHEGAITCMTTDAQGKLLFTGSTDMTVRSWDIIKGEIQKIFKGHQASVICLTVVNKMIYSASSDHTVRSWVMNFGECTRSFKGHKHTVSCMKFSDGLMFTGCGDGEARCYDSKSGALKRSFIGHDFAVNCLQIVDKKLFTGSYDGTLRVWDIDGINEDTAFGGNKEVEKSESAKENEKTNGVNNHGVDKNQNGIENGHRKIMIGDEEDSVPNGHSHMNGNLGHLEDSDDDNVQPKAMRNQGLI